MEDGAINGLPCWSRRILVPDEVNVPTAEPEYRWFPSPRPRTRKALANATPSAAQPVDGASVETLVTFGMRLPLRGDIANREDALGNALHAILAAELLQPGNGGREGRAQRILDAHDIATVVNATDALAMVDQFRAEIDRRFRPRRVLVEVPFSFLAATGERVSGFIDLLIETENGCVIVDHKTYPGGQTGQLARALSHSGQLRLCRDAAVSAGYTIDSLWIHFLVAGNLIEVRF
jgi:hypothetical protein